MFAMVSFPDPHHPFTPPGKYWDMYDPREMVVPASLLPSERKVPPHVRWVHEQRAAGKPAASEQTVFAVNEREAREAMALTCGMITMVDDAVGRVLARLDRHGLADNTVVVFTSDHGDFLGDHGLMLKGPMHFQGLIRVPLIWKDTPDAAVPGQSEAICGTLDLAATILDRAQVEPNNGMQGNSLLPAVGGGSFPNDSALIEEDGQRTILGFALPPRVRSLVTEGWRISIYHNASWGELYNLAEDPGEMNNLWDDPGSRAVKSAMLEQMVRKELAIADTSPMPTSTA